MSAAYVYEAVRTPFGRYGGALSGVRPDDLAAEIFKALLGRVPALDPEQIDDVIYGTANGSGEDNRDVARMAVLPRWLANLGAWSDCQSAVRLEPRSCDPGCASDRDGRCDDHRRRRW